MLTFNVIKEKHGWAIRMGEGMTAPFWSRDLAVREANRLADAIRCHGECIEVIVESGVSKEPTDTIRGEFYARGGAGSRSLDGSVVI